MLVNSLISQVVKKSQLYGNISLSALAFFQEVRTRTPRPPKLSTRPKSLILSRKISLTKFLILFRKKQTRPKFIILYQKNQLNQNFLFFPKKNNLTKIYYTLPKKNKTNKPNKNFGYFFEKNCVFLLQQHFDIFHEHIKVFLDKKNFFEGINNLHEKFKILD